MTHKFHRGSADIGVRKDPLSSVKTPKKYNGAPCSRATDSFGEWKIFGPKIWHKRGTDKRGSTVSN